MAEFNAFGSPVPAASAPGAGLSITGAISSTQTSNAPAGPTPGSGPNAGGSRGLAQTQGGTARSLSRAQFSSAPGGEF